MKTKGMLPSLIALFAVLLIAFPSPSFQQTQPQSPQNLLADVMNDSVVLKWTPPMDATISGFNVYKKDDTAKSEFAKINDRIINGSCGSFPLQCRPLRR